MLVSCLARKVHQLNLRAWQRNSHSFSWSRCDSRHLTTAVWKWTMRDKLQNNINHIIQHQISQVINKIFAGKKQNAKKIQSVQNVLDNPVPNPAWAKMISNPAPGPKKSHNSAGSHSKYPDPEQHWNTHSKFAIECVFPKKYFEKE